MGWETRLRGTRYYVRKVRRGGRVTSEYIGAGPVAEAIAQLDAIDREQRNAERWERRQERESFADFDRQLDDLARRLNALVAVEFEAAGFHLHKRQWRKRRDVHTSNG